MQILIVFQKKRSAFVLLQLFVRIYLVRQFKILHILIIFSVALELSFYFIFTYTNICLGAYPSTVREDLDLDLDCVDVTSADIITSRMA